MRSTYKKINKVIQSLCCGSLFFIANNIIAAENGLVAAESSLKKSPLAPEVGANVPDVDATSLVRMIIALIFVLVVVVILGWFSKRFMGVNRSSGGKIKILSATSVGAREKLMLIQVGEEQMLIGVAPGRINKLHHFDNPVVEDTEPDPKLAPFAIKLHQLIKNQQFMKKQAKKRHTKISADQSNEEILQEDAEAENPIQRNSEQEDEV